MNLHSAILLLAAAAAEEFEAATTEKLSNDNGALTDIVDGGGAEGEEDLVQEFIPKMSFSAKDYFARKQKDAKDAKYNIVTSRGPEEMRSYLTKLGDECAKSKELLEKFDELVENPTTKQFAIELYKYCSLYNSGGVYLDDETKFLVEMEDILKWGSSNSEFINYAVLSDSKNSGVEFTWEAEDIALPVTKSASYQAVDDATGRQPIITTPLLAIAKPHNSVPKKMLQLILETPLKKLEEEALLLPKALIGYVKEDEKWKFFRQRCNGIVVAGGEERTLRHCPPSQGYCCEIIDPQHKFVFMLSRHPLLPNQALPAYSSLEKPHRFQIDPTTPIDEFTMEELPFISTISLHPSTPTTFTPGNTETTPNAYQILSSLHALPNQEKNKQKCMDCLREKNGATCNAIGVEGLDDSHTCFRDCPNYCGKLCEVSVTEKPVSKVLVVKPPKLKKDPERLVPRIIHQTWFEPVTPEKYPNMARLIESWKRSGWEYIFYDDDAASEFISLHFPSEVLEAYNSIIPGAFKADLFRYCVLLIKGGIYADMDVMLEINLDAAVSPDVGFMVPVDAPGSKPDHRMCLWNGFIASAPAHPYLARAIQHVVNNIRNRFTVVDYDKLLCPNPELSVPHAFSTLFTAGPCILGWVLNEIMGREIQQTFVEGDLEIPEGSIVESIPGRTIILSQNKWDMGAHRFTWVEKNLVVAATDMPDYDDRQKLEGEDEEQATHYSKTLTRTDLYGETKVYTNRDIAHEHIVIKTESAFETVSALE